MSALATPSHLTTRVAACRGGDEVCIEMRPRPEPGPGEMLIRLRQVGLCGTDLWKLEQGLAPPGVVLGHEVVGTVASLGVGVRGFCPGDRVAIPHHVACGRCTFCQRGSEPSCSDYRANQLTPGGFSEWILIGRQAVDRAAFGIPAGVSDEAAVFLEPAACVLRGVRQARTETLTARGGAPGSVLILGGGAMGLLHLLVLRALQPDLRVVVSDPLPERRAKALELGAEAAAPPGGETAAMVAAAADGMGVDVAFDTAGGARLLDTAFSLTRPGGTVVLFAHAPAGENAGFDLNLLFKSERRLVGTYSSSIADQREIHRLLCTGRLTPSTLVTHRLPLSRFAAGVALARERRALKVLFHPDVED